MQDLDFDQDEDEMDWPEPPDIDQMKNDELYDLQPPGSGQIRISLQWIYSKVKLLKDILMHLRFQIRRDKLDKQLKESFLEEMQQPFGGFLKVTAANQALKMGDMELVDAFTQFAEPSPQELEKAR